MIEAMKKLLKENDTCVLATCSENIPHCSLMAYVPNDACDVIYMVTRRSSRKYSNLKANPRVSLLIDTRGSAQGVAPSELKALTVAGTFTAIAEEAQRHQILQQIVARHPHLQELADQPDVEPLAIAVESFLLLNGVLNASFTMLR